MNRENAKGKLRESVTDLLQNGKVGDWAFTDDNEKIYIRVPNGTEEGDFGSCRLSPAPLANVEDWQWDGNREAPTLTPSIHVVGIWHGFMTNGELVSV
jgi:hypothetical protein